MTKKSFASTLRTAQQREDKGRLQQSNDADSRRVSKSDTKLDQEKSVGDDAPRPGKIEGRGRGTETDALSEKQTDQADGKEDSSRESLAVQENVSGVSADVVRAVRQGVASQSDSGTASIVTQDDPAPVSTEGDLLTVPRHSGTAGSSATLRSLPTETGESVTAADTANQPVGLSQGTTVPVAMQSQAAPAGPLMSKTSEAPSGQPLNPMAEPAIKALDHETGEQSGTSAQGNRNEKQDVPVPPAAEGAKQASPATQELSRLDAAGPQLARLVEPPVQQKQADGAAHPHRVSHSPRSSPDASGEERAGKSMVIEPHGLRAVSDSGQHSDFLWSDQHEGQSASGKNPLEAPASMVTPQFDLSGDRSAQAMTAGNAASPQPRPVDSRPASPPVAASSLAPAHDLEPFIPTMSRSVTFEIAEPDLGRINIRVAMANERVHAYLSSDRSEVGQFLINGQDRLQSALQSNGLEMGQFRVDIDRQNAGRSFQQGPSQDQNRTWQQTSNGAPGDAGFFERHDEAGLSYAGRLNLVA